MVDRQAVDALVQRLQAYAITFGVPEVAVELGGIANAIALVDDTLKPITTSRDPLDALVKAALQQFDPRDMLNQWVDQYTQQVIQRAKTWLADQQTEVFNTVQAYVQHYVPEPIASDALKTLVASVIPVVRDGVISQAEVDALLHFVIARFDWQTVMEQWIDPKYIAIAQRVASYLHYSPLEQLTLESVVAYLQTFQAKSTAITETLIEQVLTAILSRGDLIHVDTDISLEQQKLMVKQVSIKLILQKASSPASKTAQEIAAEVNRAVLRFQLEREPGLDVRRPIQGHQPIPAPEGTNAPSGSALLGENSVSSAWFLAEDEDADA